MENSHLASFWRFLDGRFCRDRDFTDLILIISIHRLAVCPLFVARGIGPGHPLVRLRCLGTGGLGQGPVLAQFCTAARAEIR